MRRGTWSPEPKEAIIALNEHVRIAEVMNEPVSEQMCPWRWLVGPIVQKGKLFSMGGGGWVGDCGTQQFVMSSLEQHLSFLLVLTDHGVSAPC